MPSVAGRGGGNQLGGTLCNDLATTVTAFWAHINHPVGRFDDIKIVLNHHDGVAGLDQLIEHLKQQGNILKMQPSRGLIQNIKSATRTAF